MNQWFLMGREHLIGNARQQAVQHVGTPAQRLDVNIPWLTALATICVVLMGLCIALSIIGTVVLQLLD